jgi:hypothetical protein
MKKFNPIKKIPQTTVPIMQCCLDTEDLDQFRIAVYDNSNKDGKLDTVEIDFVFNTPQQGWGKSQKVKLRNTCIRLTILHTNNQLHYSLHKFGMIMQLHKLEHLAKSITAICIQN